ncbi:hypothetical protein BWK69_00630 [Candidatus Parcubacteria bacterium A4]|nr:MAG: hypothetical protein BWK69_00630 [Candidatus Parcubacteria bacterium A4]
MELKLSSKIKKETLGVWKDFGYSDLKEFVEDALRHRILELKKGEFLAKVVKIKERMEEKGMSEKEILKDFEKFSHNK